VVAAAIALTFGAAFAIPQESNANARGVKTPASPDALTGGTYALLIGISRYQTVSPLEFADKDAEMFADFLAHPRGGALPPDHIKLLTESQATRAGIDDAVRNFVDVHKGPQNKLILLIAGHGAYLHTEEDPRTHKTIQSEPYFLTWDSHVSDAKTTGYPMAEFRNMIAGKALDYGRVLVFADVCHAANIAGMAGGGELQDAVNRVWTKHEGGELGLLAAAHADKLAIESRSFGGGHGAFSYFVLAGLNGAAVDPGVTAVKWNDLAHYVNDQVFRFTNKQQSPRDYSTNEEILVIPDLQKEGISMPEARPLSSQDVRDVRSRAYIPPIALQRLPVSGPLPEDRRRLKVALEDRGQQVMNRYIEGDQIAQQRSDFEGCAHDFEEALRIDPSDAFDRSRQLFCRGRAEIFSGNYADAERTLLESVRLDAGHAYAYNALGIARLEQISRASNQAAAALFDSAADYFRQAMRYAPYWPYPVHNLALLLTERGDFDGAIRMYQSAMKIAPQYSYLPYNLGLLYERLGDLNRAQQWFEEAKRVAEKYRRLQNGMWFERAQVWNALGTVASGRGRYAVARDDFKLALLDNPQDLNARQNLAILLAKEKDFAGADKLWLANLANDPDFLPSRISYADSLRDRGDIPGAIREYTEIAGGNPKYGGAHKALAALDLAQHNTAEALEQVNAALAIAPGDFESIDLRGDIRAQLGQVDLARLDWTAVARSSPDRAVRARAAKKLSGSGSAR
jgi:tetratricopeptide (TPR) repeat protein